MKSTKSASPDQPTSLTRRGARSGAECPSCGSQRLTSLTHDPDRRHRRSTSPPATTASTGCGPTPAAGWTSPTCSAAPPSARPADRLPVRWASVDSVTATPRGHRQGLRHPGHRPRPARRVDRPRGGRRLRPLPRRRPGRDRLRHARRPRPAWPRRSPPARPRRAPTWSRSASPRPTCSTSRPAASTCPARCSPPATTRPATTASSSAGRVPRRSARTAGSPRSARWSRQGSRRTTAPAGSVEHRDLLADYSAYLQGPGARHPRHPRR